MNNIVCSEASQAKRFWIINIPVNGILNDCNDMPLTFDNIDSAKAFILKHFNFIKDYKIIPVGTYE